MANINRQIAEELGVREQQINATVALLDGGATVPFVARYRKEVTGGLDDAQLRTLEERLTLVEQNYESERQSLLSRIQELENKPENPHGPTPETVKALQAQVLEFQGASWRASSSGRDRPVSHPRTPTGALSTDRRQLTSP